MPSMRTSKRLLGTLVLTAILPMAAHAETITWNGASGGTWGTATNWDPEDVPDDATEEATFPSDGGALDVVLDRSIYLGSITQPNPDLTLIWNSGLQLQTMLEGGFVSAGSVLPVGGAWLSGKFTNLSTGLLELPAGTTFQAMGPEIQNDGTIRVNPLGSSANTYFRADAYDVLLSGSGDVVLATAGDPDDAQMSNYYGSWAQGPDHTIHGTGRITAPLTNQGTVTADVAGMVLQLDSGAKTNSGLLQATSDGILRIQSGPITQTETGRIFANGSDVRLGSGASVSGGTFESSGDARVEVVGGSALTDITNLGDFGLRGGTTTQVYGSLHNDGTLTVNSDDSSANCYLRADAYNVLLDGSGEIVLAAPGDIDDATITRYYGSWINGPNHTIRGSGKISTELTNEGRIVADDGDVALRCDAVGQTNNGVYEATGDGRLEIYGTVLTQGPFGVIRANDATVLLQAGAQITGGTFESYGDGHVDVSGSAAVLDNTNSGEFGLRGGANLQLRGTTFTNDGTIRINTNESSANTYITAEAYGVELAGSGELVLQAPGALTDAQIRQYYGSLVNGETHTIRGTGQISADISNLGTIVADADSSVLQLYGGSKANDGLLAAIGTSTLRITGPQLTQSENGRIRADGGRVQIDGGSVVTGGVFETANDGHVDVVGTSTFSNVANSGVINIDACVLQLTGQTTTNDGVITVNSSASSANTYLRTDAYGHRLEGTGSVVLQTLGSIEDAQITSYYGDLTQGANHTIRGEGRIAAPFGNEGLVVADVPEKTLQLYGNAFTNFGMLAAEGGGRLLSSTSQLSNPGTIDARTGSLVEFAVFPLNYDQYGDVLSGGTWIARTDGEIRMTNGPISTLAAHVLLDGPNSAFTRDAAGTDALGGLVAIALGGELELQNGRDFVTAGPLSSLGDIVVGTGSTLTISGNLAHSLAAPRGCKTVVNGTLACADSAFVGGGWLMGAGTVDGFVRNSCRMSPGDPTGTLTIDGDFEQTADARFYIEIGGTAEGEYDRLHVTGEARLDGTLRVVGLDEYEPTEGDEFQILTHGTRTGEFAEVIGCPGPEFCVDVEYRADGVWIVVHHLAPAGIEDGEPDGSNPDEPVLPRDVEFRLVAASGAAAQLELALPEASNVQVAVFDATGRRVAALANGSESAGRHVYEWGIGQVPSGVYFARANVSAPSGGAVRVARVVRVR